MCIASYSIRTRYSCVSIPGDWNADISDVNSVFATHLKDFCSDIDMVISDEAMLAGDTFTQLSERWHSTSWLDHCLSTSDGHNLITAMQLSVEDRQPMSIILISYSEFCQSPC